MAMKATAHENNEKSDKSNNVDSDDVINVSVSGAVSVSTEATLAAITVSTRTAGEASTTTTPTSTPRTLLDEQLVKTTTTTTLATPTPTPTEIVQISNEVNLETITVQNVTKDKSNKNNVQASDINNLLITNGEAKNNNSDVNSQTQPINNSDVNSQTQPINNSIYSTTTAATTTTTPTSLLTDLKANSKLNEQETNNIGETETTAAATTTTPPTTTEATTATVRSIATTETAAVAVVNALDESTATTSVVTAATPATAAAKDALDPFGDRDSNKDNDDNVDVEKDDDEEHKQQQIEHDSVTEQQLLSKVNMANETTTSTTTTTSEGTTTTTEGTTTTTTTTTETTTTTTTTTSAPTTTTTEEPFISLLDDSTTTTSTTARTTPTTTTTTEPVYSSTTNVNININSNTFNKSNSMLPVASSTVSIAHINVDSTTAKPTSPTINNIMVAGVNHVQQPHGNTGGTDVNVIIAITVSVIGVVALVLLVGFLYFMRKRQKQTSYGQRCRPVSLDAYSLDNVSVLGSVRRKGRDLRASKRTYGNAAFDDPSLRHNLLSATELAKFAERRSSIYEEFRDVPQISARPDEVPAGCEDKNRFANIIPLPETRVVLQRQADDDKTEYINANYVRGPHDAPNYYIACQAPMESTTGDFWRMIWEQQSRVIVQATDLSEEGIERCAEYLPPSVTLDNHSNYGDFQVTLKHREVKDKYAISTLMLKRVDGAECRELTHYWYKWPEAGVPLEEAPIIAMLLEARSSLKSYALEQANELKHEKSSTLTLKSMEGQTQQTAVDADKCSTSSAASNEINGNVANKTPRSQQGPLTIHCSPGTGRTGTIIACDMAIRSLETPKRSVDIPQLVYYVRRGRAKAVQTREQYEFIYKVANMYATKITNLSNDN